MGLDHQLGRNNRDRKEGQKVKEAGGDARAQDGRRGPELVLVLGCVTLEGGCTGGVKAHVPSVLLVCSQCAPGVLPVCSRCVPSVFQVCSQCAPGVTEAAAPICPPTRVGQPSSTLCPWNSGQGVTGGIRS